MGSSAFLTVLLLGVAMNSGGGSMSHRAGLSGAGTSRPGTSKSSSSKPAHVQQTTAQKNSNKNSTKDTNKESKTNNAYAAVAPLDNSKAGLQAMEVDMITGLEKDGIEAGLKKNRTWFQSYLADDLTAASANGVSEDKAKVMARALDPANVVESKTFDELIVRPYGEDVMIATGKVSEKGKSNNADYNVQRAFMHVWVNRLGQWQQVAIQETSVQPGAAQDQSATPAATQAQEPAIAPSASPGVGKQTGHSNRTAP